ncbi:putative hydrolase of the HAD superfamily [Aquimarina intermedia]|uniref:Putative hydrolase of the HAD superfamily n=2 Tax=Aquimarina intermedia TaxID=350814 RepID=A0A5S5BZ40_9FLAO|nr:putative hydrolase of the HAD superfamily [Aquimarina intermedia]
MIKKIIIFDLDDTLYKEINYLRSAYQEISRKIASEVKVDSEIIYSDMLLMYFDKRNVFASILKKYSINGFSPADLLNIYRGHYPDIKLSPSIKNVLDNLKNSDVELGLITDGRSIQQRNKIKSLGLDLIFKYIIISEEFGTEKPAINNYKFFENLFGKGVYYYVGDNIKKDFVSPNALGWKTICLLDDGNNIHAQDFSISKEYQPKFVIKKISEIQGIID